MKGLRLILPTFLAGSLLLIGGLSIVVHLSPARPEGDMFGSRNDPALLQEISRWKPGRPPPARLLVIPSDIQAILAESAPTYPRPSFDDSATLAAITNEALLAAVAFDPRATPESVGLAARRFVELRGAERLSRLLAQKLKRERSGVTGARVEMLEELFRVQRGTYVWKAATGVFLYHIPSLHERMP